MNIEHIEQTQGAAISKSAYENVTVSEEKETGVKTTVQFHDKYGFIKDIPPLLQSLEENLPFTSVLTGVIGYIVISAFGHMDSIVKYFGYILFLSVSFLLYKLLGKDRITIEFKQLNWIILLGFIILLIILTVEHGMYHILFNFLHIK